MCVSMLYGATVAKSAMRMIGIMKRFLKMPRKNINMSSEQLDQLRLHKSNFQYYMKIGQLSDVAYVLRLAGIVEKTIEMKKGK